MHLLLGPPGMETEVFFHCCDFENELLKTVFLRLPPPADIHGKEEPNNLKETSVSKQIPCKHLTISVERTLSAEEG